MSATFAAHCDPIEVGLLAERDVSGNRVVEEVALLEHEADVAPRAPIVDGPQVGTVELDRALCGLEQPGDELDERRLPRSGATDERDGGSGGDVEVDACQHGGRL